MKTQLVQLILFVAAIVILSPLILARLASANQPKTFPTPMSAASTPKVSPTPVTTPLPTPVTQTIDDLQARMVARLTRPETRRGMIGIKIVSLNSGKVIFEDNAEKYLMPASNMKNFTIATAMEKLTPDFRFVTSVYANSMPDASGTVKGDLRIFGRGDISISTAFNNSDYYKGLDNLVDKIATAGVKRVEGALVGDESYFQGFAIPGTWEWDDLQWYYGAEISALPINDNAVDVSVTAGPVGYQCTVKILPVNPVFRVENRCTTSVKGSARNLEVNKRLAQNILEITGTMPVGDTGFRRSVSVSHPAELFMALLKQRLELRGITITGQARTIQTSSILPIGAAPPVEIAKLESPPFGVIAAKTLKPSQNMYTETILWTLGERSREDLAAKAMAASPNGKPVSLPSGNSDVLGLAVVKEFLKQIGLPDDAIRQYDGSGLSRRDLITPAAVVALYSYMAKQSRFSQAWRDSLTIGGVDGTLATRFKGTAAAGNVRGKTGTIDQVSALSGYVTTAAGEPLVFSIVVNGVPEGRMRTSLIDDIVVSLANFNGNID